jgi:hypothetical protein
VIGARGSLPGRITVEFILEGLSAGAASEQILDAHSAYETVQAVLALIEETLAMRLIRLLQARFLALRRYAR